MTTTAIREALDLLSRNKVGEAQVVLHEALGDLDDVPLPVCGVPGNPVSQCDGGE